MFEWYLLVRINKVECRLRLFFYVFRFSCRFLTSPLIKAHVPPLFCLGGGEWNSRYAVCFATECVWCHESGVKFAHVLECDPSALSSFVVYGKHDNTAINDFSIGCVYFPPHMHPFLSPSHPQHTPTHDGWRRTPACRSRTSEGSNLWSTRKS